MFNCLDPSIHDDSGFLGTEKRRVRWITRFDALPQQEVGCPQQLFFLPEGNSFHSTAVYRPSAPALHFMASLLCYHPGRGTYRSPALNWRKRAMPNGTLDLMKLDGQPVTYQIMFEQNAGGTFVARV